MEKMPILWRCTLRVRIVDFFDLHSLPAGASFISYRSGEINHFYWLKRLQCKPLYRLKQEINMFAYTSMTFIYTCSSLLLLNHNSEGGKTSLRYLKQLYLWKLFSDKMNTLSVVLMGSASRHS